MSGKLTLNLPIFLTLFRIAMVPFFMVAFYASFPGHMWWAVAFFMVAAITDWLDGYFARVMNMSTRFGAFLDPVADKILVLFALLVLVAKFQSIELTILATLVLAREFVVLGLREWMGQLGLREKINVSSVAKCKTAVLMAGMVGLMLADKSIIFYQLGRGLVWVAVMLSLASMWQYLKSAWPHLTVTPSS